MEMSPGKNMTNSTYSEFHQVTDSANEDLMALKDIKNALPFLTHHFFSNSGSDSDPLMFFMKKG